jgi:hypothetical protein
MKITQLSIKYRGNYYGVGSEFVYGSGQNEILGSLQKVLRVLCHTSMHIRTLWLFLILELPLSRHNSMAILELPRVVIVTLIMYSVDITSLLEVQRLCKIYEKCISYYLLFEGRRVVLIHNQFLFAKINWLLTCYIPMISGLITFFLYHYFLNLL